MKSILSLGLGVAFLAVSANNGIGQSSQVSIDLSRYRYCSDMAWESPAAEAEEKRLQLGCQPVTAVSEVSGYLRSILTAMEIQSEKFTLLTTQQLKKCISLDDQLYRNIIVNDDYVNSLPVSSEEKKIIFIFSIGHEVAHHIHGDFHRGYGSGMEWENQLAELNADLWAGKALGKVLDVGQEQIRSALGTYFKVKHDDFYHPAFEERILWVLGGWLQAESANWKSGVLQQLGTKWYQREVFRDGDIKIAEFESSQKQKGFGVYLCNAKDEYEGDKYFGQYEDGSRNGVCSMYYSNLAREHIVLRRFAFYSNGVCSGYSESYLKGGDRHFGSYSNDQRNGFGIYAWSTGKVYIGEFQDGKFSGAGIIFRPEEGAKFGQFVDDKFVLGSSDRYTRRKQ